VTWFLLCVGAFGLVLDVSCRALNAALRHVATALGLPLTTRTRKGEPR